MGALGLEWMLELSTELDKLQEDRAAFAQWTRAEQKRMQKEASAVRRRPRRRKLRRGASSLKLAKNSGIFQRAMLQYSFTCFKR